MPGNGMVNEFSRKQIPVMVPAVGAFAVSVQTQPAMAVPAPRDFTPPEDVAAAATSPGAHL
jgi:hypothetical protein